MTSNLSILEHNIIDGLGGAESFACTAFLRALEVSPLPVAEDYANEVMSLTDVLAPMVNTAASIQGRGGVPAGLLDFILSRHWHMWFKQPAPVFEVAS